MEVLSKIIELKDSPAMKLSTARPIDIAWRRSFHRLESKNGERAQSSFFWQMCCRKRQLRYRTNISDIYKYLIPTMIQIPTATLICLNAAEFLFHPMIFRDGSNAVVKVVWFHMGKCATQINQMECHLPYDFSGCLESYKGFFCQSISKCL